VDLLTRFLVFSYRNFFPHSTKIMAHLAREVGKSQRQGRNATVAVAPPPSISSPSASVPSAASAASDAEKNIVVERQQAQESKYPLWPSSA
jgi:hypothetical protein